MGAFGVVIPTFTLISGESNANDVKVIPTLPDGIAVTHWRVILCEIKMLFCFFRLIRQDELLNTPFSLGQAAHDAQQNEGYNQLFLNKIYIGSKLPLCQTWIIEQSLFFISLDPDTRRSWSIG
jgi:hypothetical protein